MEDRSDKVKDQTKNLYKNQVNGLLYKRSSFYKNHGSKTTKIDLSIRLNNF